MNEVSVYEIESDDTLHSIMSETASSGGIRYGCI